MILYTVIVYIVYNTQQKCSLVQIFSNCTLYPAFNGAGGVHPVLRHTVKFWKRYTTRVAKLNAAFYLSNQRKEIKIMNPA